MEPGVPAPPKIEVNCVNLVTQKMSNQSGDGEMGHLEDVEDGCGCAEIWERASEHRNEEGDGAAPDRQ
jgi:hypothetical protein